MLCLKCSKSTSKHRGTCSILDVGIVWRRWQRGSLILFIGISFLLYDAVKSYCEKLVLKTKPLEFSIVFRENRCSPLPPHTLTFDWFSPNVTLKIRAMSPKPNQVFIMPIIISMQIWFLEEQSDQLHFFLLFSVFFFFDS